MIPEYLDQNCIVYQRDAMDFVRVLQDNSVQLILTDPPGTNDPITTHKNFSQMEAVELCAALADAAFRVLTPSGVLIIRLSNQASDGVTQAVTKRTLMQAGGLLWDSDDLDSVFILFNRGDPKSNDGAHALDILEDLIKTYSDPGDVVVDPFCGSGRVLEAAVKNDRLAFVNDIDPDAVAATIARYKDLSAR